MADWFKFYNDGLDSKGMQYAISEQPLVPSVWLLLMSEASKNRSNKFQWADEDFELIGFARRINISVPILNQCISLLARIKYIIRGNGFIEIAGWDKMQSDYAKGLNRGYYKKHSLDTSEKLASNSLVSTVRGEEKRGEENITTVGAAGAAVPVKRKKSNPPDSPEHQAFIKGWCQNYEEANKVKYQFDGGRDGRAVKQLLSMGIMRIDLLEIAKSAWKMPDPYLAKQSLTIHGFRSNFNPIQTGLKNANTRSTDKPNPRNAGTIAPVTDYGAAARRKIEAQAQAAMASEVAGDAITPPAASNAG